MNYKKRLQRLRSKRMWQEDRRHHMGVTYVRERIGGIQGTSEHDTFIFIRTEPPWRMRYAPIGITDDYRPITSDRIRMKQLFNSKYLWGGGEYTFSHISLSTGFRRRRK